jgi:hypothetical protein
VWHRTHRGPGREGVSSGTTESDVKVKTYPISQTSQNAHFHERLLVKPFLVANNLDGNNATISMIHASHDLPE